MLHKLQQALGAHKQVVPWTPGYWPNINEATANQRQFYYWLKHMITKGKRVEIGEYDGYLYYFTLDVYNDVISGAKKGNFLDVYALCRNFIRLYKDDYPKPTRYILPTFLCVSCLANSKNIPKVIDDMNLASGLNWIIGYNPLFISMCVSIFGGNSNSRIPSKYLESLSPKNPRSLLTLPGKKHYKDIMKIAQEIVDLDYTESGINYAYRMYDFEDGGICLGNYIWETESEAHLKGNNSPITIEHFKVPTYNDTKSETYISSLMREAENVFRTRSGLQKVGEGWISETLLYRKIDAAFPEIRVESHAKPSFLSPQHYDVYIPDWGIALEYQGDQHYKPVEIFGGEEAFKANIRRDVRKKHISNKNNVLQIDIKPGYNISDVIRIILSSNNSTPQADISLEKRIELSNSIVNQPNAHDIHDALNSILNEISSKNSEDAELEKKIQHIISKMKQYSGPGNDDYDVSVELIEEFHRIEENYKDDPARMNDELIKLLHRGYTAPAIYERMGINYRKLKDYKSSAKILLRGKKDFGYNFDDRIKKDLRRLS